MMDFHNQGGEIVLEGFDEWNGGNFVTVDGSDFYIKSTETRVRELNIIISYARQYFRWFDRDNNKWHESPTKVDNRYSLAAEIKWFDWVDGEEEPKEFQLTLATTSVIQFREYVQKLRDQGTRVNSVWTRLGIDRLERIDPETKEKQRYSRVNFTNAGAVQYDQQ
jgi:pullulanase/glycogen debranching enzyme